MNPDTWVKLYEYVQQAKPAGLTVAQIVQNLQGQGWEEENLEYYVQQAFDQVGGDDSMVSKPAEMPAGAVGQTYTPPSQTTYTPPTQHPQQPTYGSVSSPSAYPAPTAYTGGNTSGQGAAVPVPPEVEQMGWSWGGFGLNWIWGIGNKTMIALLALIPCVNIFVAIWLGISGHKMAWQNRRFDSFQQYQETMRVWNLWGLWIFIASLLLNVLGGLVSVIANN